jgi:hypothetical protein
LRECLLRFMIAGGRRISMALRYALLALGLAVCGVAQAQTPPQPSEVLLGLGGYCWEADLGSGATDTHCFSVARGGHLVMGVHKVRSRSGGVMYEGATLYRVEPETGAVRYDYFNSSGGLLTGYARRESDRILFPDEPDTPTVVVWYLGAEAYESGPVDESAPRTRFVKIGPAPEGGF